MSRLNQAIYEIHKMDEEAAKRREGSDLHPLSILLITIIYIGMIASVPKYELLKLLEMGIFLITTGIWCDIPLRSSFRRLKYVLLLPLFLGMANLIFDRQIVGVIGRVSITGGMLSMGILLVKSVLMVSATYFMILRIGMEGICLSLKVLHVPGILITQMTLTYRYVVVLLREMERMWTSYHMRAPGQRGIQKSVWGSFVGMLFFRSLERATVIFQSMQLRGYQEERGIPMGEGSACVGKSIGYVVFWIVVFVLLRNFSVFTMFGDWILR